MVIRQALQCLAESKPRRISAWSGRLPVIVFTDGACEDEGNRVTHGATVFDPEDMTAKMFSDNVLLDQQMVCARTKADDLSG